MPAIPMYESQVTPTVKAPTMEFKDYSGEMVKPKMEFDNSFMLKLIDEQNTAIAQEGQNEMEKYITDLRDGTVNEQTGKREGGWASLKGANALKPDADGKGLADRTRESVQKKAEELAANMSPGAAKKFRENYAKGRVEDVYREASGYVLKEDMSARETAYNSGVAIAEQRASRAVDGAEVQRSMSYLDATLDRQADFMGWDANTRKVKKLESHSRVHSQKIDDLLSLAKENPEFYARALDYLNTHDTDMTAADQTKARDIINAGMDKYTGDVLVTEGADALASPDRIFQHGGTLTPDQRHKRGITRAPSIMDRVSGGRQFTTDKNATTLTNKDKATAEVWKKFQAGEITAEQLEKATKSINKSGRVTYGASQLTEEDAKKAVTEELGMKWTAETRNQFLGDRNFNIRVGTARYNQLLKRYGGDEDKATVAYLQGEEVVDKAIKAAESKEGIEQGKTWFDYVDADGKKFLEDIRKDEETRYSSADKGTNIFDPKGWKQRQNYATIDQCREYVIQNDPKSRHDIARQDRLAQQLYNRIQQQKMSDEAEQQNGINDILNELDKSGYDLSVITPEMKARVTPSAWRQIEEYAKRKTLGDETGDRVLAHKYLANERLLASLSRAELDRLRRDVPKEEAKALEAKWAALTEKNAMAEEAIAKDKRNAQLGVYSEDYVPKLDNARTAIKYAVPEMFKKLSKEPGVMESVEHDFMMAVAARSQDELHRKMTQIELNEFAREYFDNTFDKGSVNMANLEVDDLSNESFVDVKRVCTVLAKGALENRGIFREPTDREIVEQFRRLNTLRNPQLHGMSKLTLSQERLDYVRREYKKQFGTEPTPVEELKWYCRTLMLGEKVDGEQPKANLGPVEDFMKGDR